MLKISNERVLVAQGLELLENVETKISAIFFYENIWVIRGSDKILF